MKLFQVSRVVIKQCPFCNKLSFILQYMNRSFFQWGNNHVPLLLCIYCNMIQQQLQIVSICKPFNSHEQPRKKILLTIKIQKHCNIKQKSDENKENYQLGDSLLIQYQILRSDIRILWRTSRRISDEIKGVKGLYNFFDT